MLTPVDSEIFPPQWFDVLLRIRTIAVLVVSTTVGNRFDGRLMFGHQTINRRLTDIPDNQTLLSHIGGHRVSIYTFTGVGCTSLLCLHIGS